jgi:DNA invertase Pin-like site-specific DNA recombinase
MTMPRGRYKRRDKAIYETPPPGSRMLVYIRFSGEDQDAASQEAAVRRWVEGQGWVVYPGEWFVDEARSGSSTERREQFHALVRLAERLADDPDRPAGVAVWKFNRFGRDFLDSQFYKAHLRRMGYALVSMADDIPQSNFAPVVEALLDWKAERDLEDLSSDVKRAFSELRSQGYKTGGFPPRGLLVVKEPLLGPDGKPIKRPNGTERFVLRWVPDPASAPLVQQAFAMRAEGAGYAAILRGPLHGVYKSTSCLPTFFANRNYVTAGVITEELFQQVQAVQLRSKRKEGQAHPRRVSSPFLLSGLLECRCGGQMVGETQQGRWRYYRCNRQKRERTGECTQPKIRADRLEEPILDAILSCVLTPERIAELTEAVNAELNGDDGLQAEADRLRQHVAEVEATINRLLDALEREGLESVRDRLKAREAERRKLRGDLTLVEAEIAARRPVLLTSQEVADLLGELHQYRAAEDILELRAVLRLVIERVTVDGESYQVHYKPEAKPWFTT